MKPKENLATTLHKSIETLKLVDMIEAKKAELWAKLEPHFYELPKGYKWDITVFLSEDKQELLAEARVVPDIVLGLVN